MSQKVAKSLRPKAERATEHVLMETLGCVATRRALRTKFAKVDFFAADTIGVMPDGKRFWIQVTAGQTSAVLVRRRKLQKYPWHRDDTVQVWQLTWRQSVVNPRKKDWFFRVWDYKVIDGFGEKRKWFTDTVAPIPVKVEWFKARKEDTDEDPVTE